MLRKSLTFISLISALVKYRSSRLLIFLASNIRPVLVINTFFDLLSPLISSIYLFKAILAELFSGTFRVGWLSYVSITTSLSLTSDIFIFSISLIRSPACNISSTIAVARISFRQASRKDLYSTAFKIFGASFSYFGCLTSDDGLMSHFPSVFKNEK